MKYTSIFLSITLIFVLSSVVRCSARVTYSTINEFPLPGDNIPVADPDGILSESDRQSLVETIQILCQDLILHIHCSGDLNGEDDYGDQSTEYRVPVQVAVAIVDRLNTETAHSDEDVGRLVRKFATNLHDKWGIGQQTELGGTGVLVLLDVRDRFIFISRGGALDSILTDDRLEGIISEMSSPLKQAKYNDGLLQAVESIAQYVQQGEPTFQDHFAQATPHFGLFVAFVAISMFVAEWKRTRNRREYARVRSQLTEMDQARAEALRGNFQPQTTCSICLEKIQSDTVGSDGQPIKLLRCGHIFDETCWSEWVLSGRGALTKCPVCRMDVGSNAESTVEGTVENGQGNNRVNSSIISTAPGADIDENDREQAMIQHQQERNFRLVRLSILHPGYLSTEQVTRYSSPTYNDRMASGRSFKESDPIRIEHNKSQSDSFSGFGGGLSSGGVGRRF
jgi:uncharacterized membrane protein YgcG